MQKITTIVLSLIMLFFASSSFACDFTKLKINKSIDDIRDEKSFFPNSSISEDEKYKIYQIPIEAFCQDKKYEGTMIDLYNYENKIYKIDYINVVSPKKKLVSLAKDKYKVAFEIPKQLLESEPITLQIIKDKIYYYYTFLHNEDGSTLELFEIINDERNNKSREDLIKLEEEQ